MREQQSLASAELPALSLCLERHVLTPLQAADEIDFRPAPRVPAEHMRRHAEDSGAPRVVQLLILSCNLCLPLRSGHDSPRRIEMRSAASPFLSAPVRSSDAREIESRIP